jgi:hypothetical protein
MNGKAGKGKKFAFVKSKDEINRMTQQKAQELYEKRGRIPGHEMDDWLEAERIVKKELQTETSRTEY